MENIEFTWESQGNPFTGVRISTGRARVRGANFFACVTSRHLMKCVGSMSNKDIEVTFTKVTVTDEDSGSVVLDKDYGETPVSAEELAKLISDSVDTYLGVENTPREETYGVSETTLAIRAIMDDLQVMKGAKNVSQRHIAMVLTKLEEAELLSLRIEL